MWVGTDRAAARDRLRPRRTCRTCAHTSNACKRIHKRKYHCVRIVRAPAPAFDAVPICKIDIAIEIHRGNAFRPGADGVKTRLRERTVTISLEDHDLAGTEVRNCEINLTSPEIRSSNRITSVLSPQLLGRRRLESAVAVA